jgi:hypothetical protein
MVEIVRVADVPGDVKGLSADDGCNNVMVDANSDTVGDEGISDEISQAGPVKAEVGSAEATRAEFGSSDEEPLSAADPYTRPRGFKSARIGGAGTIFQITIPAAPVTFSVLLSGDVDPRDKMLAGPSLSATFGSSESMGTTTAEPQAVPEKKMRSADDALTVENEAGPANETAATSRPSNWETLSRSQNALWRRRHK